MDDSASIAPRGTADRVTAGGFLPARMTPSRRRFEPTSLAGEGPGWWAFATIRGDRGRSHQPCGRLYGEPHRRASEP